MKKIVIMISCIATILAGCNNNTDNIQQETKDSEEVIQPNAQATFEVVEEETGNKFIGALQIKSSSKWEIITGNHGKWLSFSKDKEPQDGKETYVTLTVMADYSQFTQSTMNGEFQLQVPGTSPITIQVVAAAEFNIFDSIDQICIDIMEW